MERLAFDELELDHATRWPELRARALADTAFAGGPVGTLDLRCSVCGYGASCLAPPERCPMCQGERTWAHVGR